MCIRCPIAFIETSGTVSPEAVSSASLAGAGVKDEFTVDLDKMKSLLKTVEEKSKLVKLLDLCMRHDDMTVMIGEEHFADEMQGCSLIAQNYLLDNEKIGTVAIFGPKRMDYKKMISIVNVTANTVSELLSDRNTKGATMVSIH